MTRRWGRDASGSDAAAGRIVELCLRGRPEFGVEARKEAAIEALETLADRGVIDSFEVTVWPDEIRPTGPLASTEYHRSVMARVREFEHWLRQHGASIEDTFERRTVSSSIVDEEYGVIVLPCMCLALYEDGDLAAVYPRREGDRALTLADCFRRLESDADDERLVFGEPAN